MNAKQSLRVKRVARIRSKVTGTAARPRVVVYRSNRALSVQVVDDTKHVTLVAARVSPSNKTTANVLGEDIAKKMKDKGITTIVFDRGGFIFTGRVKALAEGAREGGLKF